MLDNPMLYPMSWEYSKGKSARCYQCGESLHSEFNGLCDECRKEIEDDD